MKYLLQCDFSNEDLGLMGKCARLLSTVNIKQRISHSINWSNSKKNIKYLIESR